ncbi:MAG TPA: ABC transporter substrate-binding protein, partial [Streptosporangiaceae bacterium]|nr:ABC transporter substrate-binding protein [Streptosporangiaceae bacterium]
LHAGLRLYSTFLFLNTRQPPFTSVLARQAVNYAIDRDRIKQISHEGLSQASVTCQILPAGFPGHQPHCPYTANPGDGFWHGPDLAKARLLAQQSGTTNVPVTVWDGFPLVAWTHRLK